jgi:hypothetical protein
MTRLKLSRALGCLLLVADLTARVSAASFLSTTDVIPSPDAVYGLKTDGGVIQLTIDVSNAGRFVVFKPSQFSGGAPLPAGPISSTESVFGTRIDLSLEEPGVQTIDATLLDSAMITVHSTPTPGLYDTEISQLDLSGGGLPAGWIIRESPTLASTGQTTVDTLPGGLFRINSFFDVFVELSTDTGQSWIPASGPLHLESTPEPGSVVLASLGGLVLIGFARRQHTSQT